jgi:hypothetical protein
VDGSLAQAASLACASAGPSLLARNVNVTKGPLTGSIGHERTIPGCTVGSRSIIATIFDTFAASVTAIDSEGRTPERATVTSTSRAERGIRSLTGLGTIHTS